jgi:6-pyruvoyltetrahydropterin/6-carboxytetrahydropterin synthase
MHAALAFRSFSSYLCTELKRRKMPVLITKKFRFESAHYLPMMPEGHKCRRMHGHSFRMEVNLLGDIDPESGILMDFGDLKAVVNPYVKMLDHWCINEVGEKKGDPLLQNPSSENLAKWFFQTLKPILPQLYSIIIHETCTSRCEYREKWNE